MNFLDHVVAPIRGCIMAALYAPYLCLHSTVCVVLNLIFANRELDNSIIAAWGALSSKMFGVEVRVIGAENLPKGGCIYLFNHTSYFDIFAIHWKIRGVRFGAKIELFNFPMFGRAMTRVGVLPIARNRREEVLELYKQTEVRIHNGEQFCLAPEGTRQRVEALGPLKSGPFILAINTHAPIVPLVIKGASQIMNKDSWIPNAFRFRREVELHVLPPIPTQGYSIERREELQETFRQAVAKVYPLQS